MPTNSKPVTHFRPRAPGFRTLCAIRDPGVLSTTVPEDVTCVACLVLLGRPAPHEDR